MGLSGCVWYTRIISRSLFLPTIKLTQLIRTIAKLFIMLLGKRIGVIRTGRSQLGGGGTRHSDVDGKTSRSGHAASARARRKAGFGG